MSFVLKCKAVWRAWKRFGEKMAEYFGMVLFGILYVLIFAPVAIACKLMGKHFLPRFTGEEETYYISRDTVAANLEYMKRQG